LIGFYRRLADLPVEVVADAVVAVGLPVCLANYGRLKAEPDGSVGLQVKRSQLSGPNGASVGLTDLV